MEMIKEFVSNPIAWTALCIALTILLRAVTIAKHWKQLLYFLLAVIQVFDARIHNIITPEQESKLGRIKKIIARSLTARAKKDIDNLLSNMKLKGAGDVTGVATNIEMGVVIDAQKLL